MPQDTPTPPPTPRPPADPPAPLGPIVLLPENQPLGTPYAENMISSDLRLQSKIPFEGMESAADWHPPMALPFHEPTGQADVCQATDFAVNSPANVLVPNPPAPAEEEEHQVWEFTGPTASQSTKDVGIRDGQQTGIREYLASGYTRRNPDGTDWSDHDWAGKWDDAKFSVAQAQATSESFFDVSVAEGEFGDEGDLFSGSGRVLGADSDARATFELSNKGLDANARAQANGSFLEGQIASDDTQIVAGEAEGKVLSAEAEASAQVILSPEEATLQGKLGASASLLEGKLGGDLYLTPRRVANPVINAWNYLLDDDVEELSENWDIGIMVGGEVSGQIGAQAAAEGQVGYENGRATAEAGAKLGLGIGAGVKARGGLVGLDKVWSGVTSGWNALWD